MPGFFDQVILDNTVREYAAVGSVIIVAYLLKKFIGVRVCKLFFLAMKKWGEVVDERAFMDLILAPIKIFSFLLVSIVALSTLKFPSALLFEFYRTNTKEYADAIGTGILIITFFWMLLRMIDYLALVMERKADLTPDQSDNQLVVFFKDFLKVILVIIGLLTITRLVFNYKITELLAGLSIAGAAIALAARESIENLIASFIIFFDKPFATGDLLKVNNITGTVERIGLRSTRIRTTEKTYVTVPNKQMVDSIVDNLTLRTQRRGELRLEISVNTNAAQLQALLAGIDELLKDKLVLQKSVFLQDILQKSFLVQGEYFTDAILIEEFNQLKQRINLEAIQLLEQLKIEIAGVNTEVKILNPEK
jgi:MscS family membrane protein